eukprot:TRINITY_DN3949_c0_g2_i1.p1 TRINITY_DN3949_c0_g2~~TRINITY_DN3949_c0_g2_i1.p1  ORF type:complete len:348 (-),score=74.12 TRINITY_DN3949_c0_g2_i1:140-1183(-)
MARASSSEEEEGDASRSSALEGAQAGFLQVDGRRCGAKRAAAAVWCGGPPASATETAGDAGCGTAAFTGVDLDAAWRVAAAAAANTVAAASGLAAGGAAALAERASRPSNARSRNNRIAAPATATSEDVNLGALLRPEALTVEELGEVTALLQSSAGRCAMADLGEPGTAPEVSAQAAHKTEDLLSGACCDAFSDAAKPDLLSGESSAPLDLIEVRQAPTLSSLDPCSGAAGGLPVRSATGSVSAPNVVAAASNVFMAGVPGASATACRAPGTAAEIRKREERQATLKEAVHAPSADVALKDLLGASTAAFFAGADAADARSGSSAAPATGPDPFAALAPLRQHRRP